ncbi:hypothetical protein PMAYCL1PPCAC_16938, partial [Pristionchus mayeri]
NCTAFRQLAHCASNHVIHAMVQIKGHGHRYSNWIFHERDLTDCPRLGLQFLLSNVPDYSLLRSILWRTRLLYAQAQALVIIVNGYQHSCWCNKYLRSYRIWSRFR